VIPRGILSGYIDNTVKIGYIELEVLKLVSRMMLADLY